MINSFILYKDVGIEWREEQWNQLVDQFYTYPDINTFRWWYNSDNLDWFVIIKWVILVVVYYYVYWYSDLY